MNSPLTPTLRQARAAILAGRRRQAGRLLKQAVRQDPDDYRPWLWLAGLAPTPRLQQQCLERAQALAPNAPAVKRALAQTAAGALASHAPASEASFGQITAGALASPAPASEASFAQTAAAPAAPQAPASEASFAQTVAAPAAPDKAAPRRPAGPAASARVRPEATTPAPRRRSSWLRLTAAAALVIALALLLAGLTALNWWPGTTEAGPVSVAADPALAPGVSPAGATVTDPGPDRANPGLAPATAGAIAPRGIRATEVPKANANASDTVTARRLLAKAVVAPASDRLVWTPTPRPTSTPTPLPTATSTPTPFPTFVGRNNAAAVVPPVAIAADERWVDINLSTQTLVAYEGRREIFRTAISSGTSQHPTVTGQFRIYLRYERQTMDGRYLGFDYYLPNVPYVMYFYQGYALHGTYWHSNFGTPMSHGCVNMHTEDAGWVFSWAGVGTLVNVHY